MVRVSIRGVDLLFNTEKFCNFASININKTKLWTGKRL